MEKHNLTWPKRQCVKIDHPPTPYTAFASTSPSNPWCHSLNARTSPALPKTSSKPHPRSGCWDPPGLCQPQPWSISTQEPNLVTWGHMAVALTCPGGEVLLGTVVLVQLEALEEVGAVLVEWSARQEALQHLG